MEDWLSALNPSQLDAVRHTGGPLLILAGAGSGKTRVITTKIAWLIREQGLDPESILAVTFTNKAAREMAERASLIEPRAARAMLRTFHSFGSWFLRRYAGSSSLGLNERFVIYDNDDSIQLLTTLREDLPRAKAAQAYHRISRAKDYFYSPEAPLLDEIDGSPDFRALYRSYEKRLREIGNVDFGDLIKLPVELLREDTALRERFRQRFRVILVDEYQDSNVAQFELLRELCGPGTYLCVVGDDDQSIYRFRGAEVRNILDFPNLVQGTTVIRLEENYRSVQPILRAAESVVSRNEGRLGKTMVAARGEGALPVLAFLHDQDAEAAFAAELVLQSARPYSDWAILYRTNAQSMGFESEFLRRKIPYRVVGSLKFYEREEVKDALALAAFVSNPRDEVAFRRVVNKPARGIGGKAQDRIVDAALSFAGSELGDLERALERVGPALASRAKTGCREFLSVISRARALLGEAPGASDAPATDGAPAADDTVATESLSLIPPPSSGAGDLDERLRAGEGLSHFFVQLSIESGIAAYHEGQDEVAGTQRLANLQELANAASLYEASFDGLALFLEHIELDRAEQEAVSDDAVTLITIHNTKGLEFPRVIMTGVEQGVFPRDDKRDEDLEEERRLFYVGATRAMDELYLSSCALRRLYGRTQPTMPSIFLRELPSSGVRVLGKAPPGFRFADAPGATGSRRTGFGDGGQEGISTDADGRWPPGTRLFHDDYGYGAVIGPDPSSPPDEARLLARFESGARVSFDPIRQKNRFMKVAPDA